MEAIKGECSKGLAPKRVHSYYPYGSLPLHATIVAP
ncbi:MAG: hypothetical protein GDYSWBUE_001816, partial [Candidatus Fervidibacterota bacterium]